MQTTRKILLQHLQSHNLSIIAASAAALLLAIMGWATLYFAIYWATMLVSTILYAGSAALPPSFHPICISIMLLLLSLAWLDSHFFPNQTPPDGRPAIENITDLLYFIPRITLSVIQNFSAWASLKKQDIQPAADFLNLLRKMEKIPLQSLPMFIAGDSSRRRILDALTLSSLIYMRHSQSLMLIHLSPSVAEKLRSIPDNTDDNFSDMSTATVLEKKNPLPASECQSPLHDGD